MITFIKRVNRRINKIFSKNSQAVSYDFNISNPLGGNGERVDIQLNKNIGFDKLDIYQKNHWRRYEFARELIEPNDVCGDFACGTGYGSIMLSDKAIAVTGADLNAEVIDAIKERYKYYNKVNFLNENLLNLNFENYFDKIVSFETLEHFNEPDFKKLLLLFNKALVKNGKLIFSTPYLQEASEAAVNAGFHLTFYINEEKINNWMNEAGFTIESLQYQNYDTHSIERVLQKKEFIVGVAIKNN